MILYFACNLVLERCTSLGWEVTCSRNYQNLQVKSYVKRSIVLMCRFGIWTYVELICNVESISGTTILIVEIVTNIFLSPNVERTSVNSSIKLKLVDILTHVKISR